MQRKELPSASPVTRHTATAVSSLVARAGAARGKDVAYQVAPFIPPKSSVLDLGCGRGFVAQELKKLGHRVVGVDISDTRLALGFEFIQGSAYDLPFEDDTFDICLMHTVLHHLESPDEALKEAHRVARRTVVGEELRIPGLNWWILRNYDRLANLTSKNNPHSNKTHANWLRLFEEVGFSVDKKIESKVFGFIHQVIYGLQKLS